MKKNFLTACFSAVVLAASAQGRPGTFSLTPKVGVAIAKITKSDLIYEGRHAMEPKYRGDFAMGVEGAYQHSDMLSLTLGAYYAALGYRIGDTEILQSQTDARAVYSVYRNAYTRLDYVLMPVMVNLYVAKGFALKGGLQAGFLVNAKTEMKISEVTYDKSTGVGTYTDPLTQKNTSRLGYHQFDLSMPLGLSYEYMNVVLDARYNLGLLKMSTTSGAKNASFTFTVGYKFAL